MPESEYIYTIRSEHTHGGGIMLQDSSELKLGFHGATPTAKRAGAAQVQVESTAIADAAGEAPTAAEYNAAVARVNTLTTLCNELRAALVEKGLIKGAE